MKVTTLIAGAVAAAALLMLATSAKAADLKVPYKVCLTQAQAAQVYPGKHLKYREVGKERCWYAGKTLPKHAFKTNPRATGVAAKPTRLIQQEHTRVQEPSGSIPDVGDLSYEAMMADAFLALTGLPESAYTFDAMWSRATGWQR